MDGNKRRQAIIDILKNSLQPVSGTYLAKTLQVSTASHCSRHCFTSCW